MAESGGLVVYVTSHGFGHLNRTVAVLNRLPGDVPVTIRCHPDLFPHWGERLTRPATLEPGVWDSGAINPPGDSAATDGPATIERGRAVFEEAMGRVDDEAARLRDGGAAAVLCDAPAVPLVAAKRAGIPGFLLANFTWADIYGPHAKLIGKEAMAFVSALKSAYAETTAIFRAEPALRMAGVAPIIDVGMVVSKGRDRRAELRELFGIAPQAKVVYFYIGRYGQAGLGWNRLARLEGVHFVGFHPAPVGPLPNVHVAPSESWTGADLAASADAIVAKAGYGTACEAIASGTPLIYPPREGFAEHKVLDRALRLWGGGVAASARAFQELRLEALLKHAFSLNPGPPPFPVDGADRVAAHLAKVCRDGIAPADAGGASAGATG